ncbi:MAG: hypothetical protein KatS3mg102_0403 [Planctomycetota bacterium]|nr:MAG: hypothetical protein KatS3mg102_0403 [Planctomycetota bacterium]
MRGVGHNVMSPVAHGHRRRARGRGFGWAGLLAVCAACGSTRAPLVIEPAHSGSSAAAPAIGTRLERRGQELIACGQLFHAGTPVITWLDPGGFDAYRPHRTTDADAPLPLRPAPGCDTPSRLGAGRAVAEPGGSRVPPPTAWDLDLLRRQVTQVVLHYDAAWTSANCFRVLHDVRGLSVHLLIDLDGTVYQSCDLKERARHAGPANDRSIGIEIAHPGPLDGQPQLRAAYRRDADGPWLEVPARFGRSRTAGFVPRPARPEPIAGEIHGQRVSMYDFTEEQYRALARVLAALHRICPQVRLEAPRGPDGEVLRRALSAEELASFRGVLGHWHVTARKLDPGPAFDWERVLAEARRHAAARALSAREAERSRPSAGAAEIPHVLAAAPGRARMQAGGGQRSGEGGVVAAGEHRHDEPPPGHEHPPDLGERDRVGHAGHQPQRSEGEHGAETAPPER